MRGKRERGAPDAAAPSFADTLRPLFAHAAEQAVPVLEHEPLAHLDYADERAVKQQALQRYWSRRRLPGEPGALIASPKARGYRTSTKRRVAVRNNRVALFLGEHPPLATSSLVVSPLEPAEHAEIYELLRATLEKPVYRPLAAHLSYLILRGSYTERALVLNVDTLNGTIVRKVKMLAEVVRPHLRALYVYLDPSRSNYHFESRRPDEPLTFKRIFGPDHLVVRHAGRRYHYHPTSFSQVNESIVPDLLARARDLLSPQADESLLDLYCGYGLFSHYLAPDCAQVLGVDVEGPSIHSATANTALNPCATPRRFIAARITADFVQRSLRAPTGPEAVLLDPPRNGPQTGVIGALSRRAPIKVLHVFCDVDQIPIALAQWRSAGYHPQRIVPLDMFPGAANLEVLVLLTAEAAGGKRSPSGGRGRRERG